MSNDKSYIAAHWANEDQTAIEIEMMLVVGEHGKGEGRRLYEEWEAALPKTVKLVTLFAADYDGSGNSDGFWGKMGFDWVYNAGDACDMDYESTHRMHKGVNGHPTPPTIWWEAEPEDEPEHPEPTSRRTASPSPGM